MKQVKPLVYLFAVVVCSMLLVPPSVTHAAKPSTIEAKTPPPPIEMTIEVFLTHPSNTSIKAIAIQ